MNVLWLRTWQLGIKSLLLHPLRSVLTVLGIFIGVAAVIWLLAIGEGISREAQKQIEGLGATNIILRTIKPPSEVTDRRRGLTPFGLTRDDFRRLSLTVPTLEQALPIRELRRRFSYARFTVDGRLVGCTPEYAEVTKLEIHRGRFLSDADNVQKKNYCVLAAQVADVLFPLEDPLGKKIRVESDFYVVIGVLKPRMPTAAIGGSLAAQDFSSDVYIPIETLWNRIGDLVVTMRSGSFEGEIVQLSQITLRLDKVEHVMETSELVKQTLAMSHRNVEDYGVTVPLELLEQARTTRLMFIIFMGLIAAISLVVGGIGIMNIMLATVTERTREIGIRMAVGARGKDILRQFLIESTLLSCIGGVVGIVLGVAASAGLTSIINALTKGTQWPVVISFQAAAVAMIFAGAVGVFFGYYPARRASKLDPIECLRYE